MKKYFSKDYFGIRQHGASFASRHNGVSVAAFAATCYNATCQTFLISFLFRSALSRSQMLREPQLIHGLVPLRFSYTPYLYVRCRCFRVYFDCHEWSLRVLAFYRMLEILYEIVICIANQFDSTIKLSLNINLFNFYDIDITRGIHDISQSLRKCVTIMNRKGVCL